MMNWLKKLMLFRLLILVIQFKKANYNTKIAEIEKKIPEHGKYVTTSKFNKLTVEKFTERLKEAKLPTKSDITDFLKDTYFDDRLKNIN